MPTAKTNLFMNISSVTVTPEGGAAVILTGVTDITLNRTSVEKLFWGDNRRNPRHVRPTQRVINGEIMGGDLYKLMTLSDDLPHTMIIVFDDVANASASGAITATITGAYFHDLPTTSRNNEYGEGRVRFTCKGTVLDAAPITLLQAADVP